MTDKQRNLRIFVPVYVIFAIIYIYSAIADDAFLTWGNNVNLMQRIAPLILVAIGQTFVLISGGIDLSVGSIIGLSNVVAATLPYSDVPLNYGLWLVVPLLVASGAGMINGLLVAKAKFPPIIATLATSAVFQGAALFILSQPGGSVSIEAVNVTTGFLFGAVPIPLIIFLAAIAIAHIIVTRTQFGRSMYAIGGNPNIAFESGIAVQRITIRVYTLGGFFAGLAGLFLSARMFSGDPLVGQPYVLDSIAVSVIGGTSLFLGRGGVIGILGGAYVFRLLGNILNLLGVAAFYQYVIRGLVLIIALLVTSSDASTIIRRWFGENVFKRRRQTVQQGESRG